MSEKVSNINRLQNDTKQPQTLTVINPSITYFFFSFFQGAQTMQDRVKLHDKLKVARNAQTNALLGCQHFM